MKKYIIPSIGFLTGLSLIVGGLITNEPPIYKAKYEIKPCFEIIQDTTDERGLTSIVITDGIDTFAYDYLKPQQLADFKANNFTHSLIKTDYVCPDCGETNCIYQEIGRAHV